MTFLGLPQQAWKLGYGEFVHPIGLEKNRIYRYNKKII